MKMGESSLRRTLNDRPVIGSFAGIGHPAAVETLGWRGFELICIDSEHAALGPVTIERMIRAADVSGAHALVRVAEVGPEIGRALDAGACGVVVPRVETAEQAARCVAAVRYPPTGERGAGPGRVTGYAQHIAAYLSAANDDVVLVVQVETALGVRNAEEIAAVDGVDVVFVGPGDLAVSLGVAGGSAEHTETIERVFSATRRAGKLAGIFCLTAADLDRWVRFDTRLFLLGSDLGFLGQQAGSELASARDVLATAAKVDA